MDVDSHILHLQETAGVKRMVLSSLLTMLPVITFGTAGSYFMAGLPRLLEHNGTGIEIDIYQMSWICKSSYQSMFTINTFISYLS